MLLSRLLLAVALLVPVPELPAASFGACSVKSDYTVERRDGGYRFTRTDGHAADVHIRDGRLVVDGVDATVSPADRARLRRFQSDLDGVVEQARVLGMEAAALAVDAVSEVAIAFFGDDPATLRRFEARLATLEKDIRATLPSGDGPLFDEAAFERAMESAMDELAPMLASQVAGKAVAAALSGNQDRIRDLEARAKRLEHEIEATVGRRAKDIEARAEALCPQIEAMAATLAAMDYRHADGSRLELVRSRR
jgi:hypothetical protein